MIGKKNRKNRTKKTIGTNLIHGFEYAVEIMDGFILVDGIDWVCGSSSAQKSRK